MVDVNKVSELLVEVCPCDIEEITPEKHLVRDLEIDSFGLMDLILKFEQEYDIQIPDRDLRLFNTVQDILDYLEAKQNEKNR